MLVLSRRAGEAIVIGGGVRIRVSAVRGNRVQLAIAAPDEVPIYREEIWQRRTELLRNGTPTGQSLEELSERDVRRALRDTLVVGERRQRRGSSAAGAHRAAGCMALQPPETRCVAK